jgi:hypothetical protein
MRGNFKGSLVQRAPLGGHSERPDPADNIKSYRAELNRVTQAVAVVGSVVNALEKRADVAMNLGGLVRFLPSGRLNALEIARKLASSGVERRLCADALSIANQFCLCAELTKSYASGALGDELGLAPVAHAWRQLAEACITVDHAFAAAVAGDRPGAPNRAPQQRGQLLGAVSAGLSPCVDDKGAVVVPGWAERRIHERIADVEIPVEICAGGEWQPATILDYSDHGFGLSGSTDIRVGEVISIEFETDTSVVCTVRWSANGRFGVSINGSLQSALIGAPNSRAAASSGAKPPVDKT